MAGVDNLKPFKKGYDSRRDNSGRPKGSKSLPNLIREALEDPNFKVKVKDPSTKSGFRILKHPAKLITATMIAKAMSGDVKAAEWLAKHGYGLKTVHDFNGNDPIDTILEKFGLLKGGEEDAGKTETIEDAAPKSVPSD